MQDYVFLFMFSSAKNCSEFLLAQRCQIIDSGQKTGPAPQRV